MAGKVVEGVEGGVDVLVGVVSEEVDSMPSGLPREQPREAGERGIARCLALEVADQAHTARTGVHPLRMRSDDAPAVAVFAGDRLVAVSPGVPTLVDHALVIDHVVVPDVAVAPAA